MDIDVEIDYYAVLGVSSFAPTDEIRHAYRELARRYHPDSRETNTETRLFHAVHEAYAVLANPVSRRSYDRQRDQLAEEESTPLTWNVLQSKKTLFAGHEEQVLYALLKIRPTAPSADNRLPLDLALVIDRSTSMEGPRLNCVKEAALHILDQLHDDDYLAIISFADRAELLLSDQVGATRARARTAIASLHAGGGTELLHGLETGLAELGTYGDGGAVRHVVLLTDGRTYGDDEACIAAARGAGDRGIGITVLGIGDDWNDELIDEIAAQSGGSSAYISASGQIRAMLQRTFGRISSIFATDIMLNVQAAPGVSIESVFQTAPSVERLRLRDDVARLAALEVDVPRTILFESAVETKSPGPHRLMQVDLHADIPSLDQRGLHMRQGIWCEFTDEVRAIDGNEVPREIVEAVRSMTLYRLQERAWADLAEGDIDQATSKLQSVAVRLQAMGVERLAHTAMSEAKRIAASGKATERGRKEIKYGTRRLGLRSDLDD